MSCQENQPEKIICRIRMRKFKGGASLGFVAEDETKSCSYNAAVAYDGKNYPFTVEVKDTTPQCAETKIISTCSQNPDSMDAGSGNGDQRCIGNFQRNCILWRRRICSLRL